MNRPVPVLLLLGPSNAGKSTALRTLSQSPARLGHFAVRVYFSEQTQLGTQIGRRAYELSLRQRWLPDDFVADAFAGWLDCQLADGVAGLVLEGLPRNRAQAHLLDRRLSRRGLRVDHLIHLDAPDDVVLARAARRTVCVRCHTIVVDGLPVPDESCATCGGPLVRRREDAPESASERVRHHRAAVAELLTHYDSAAIHEIDGAQPVAAVAGQLLAVAAGLGWPAASGIHSAS